MNVTLLLSSLGFVAGGAYKTAAGTAVAVAGGIAIFACYLLMRRLGRIPEPQRRGARQ